MLFWVKPFLPFVLLVTVALLHGCGDGQPRTLPQSGFQVEFGEHQVPRQMRAGETVVAPVWLGNAGNHVWPSTADAKGRKQVNLSYHWLDVDRKIVIMDGLRTHLPHDLRPSETLLLNAAIQAPPRPGNYLLQISLVQEAVAWFHEKGGATVELPVRVVAADAPAPAPASKLTDGASPASLPDAQSSTSKDSRRKRGRQTDNRARNKPLVAALDDASAKPGQALGPEVWSVQVASGQQRSVIDKRVQQLRAKGLDAYVVSAGVDGKTWYQARIGRLGSKSEAIALQSKVAEISGIAQSFVTNRQ